MAQPNPASANNPLEQTPFSIDPSDEVPVGVQLSWRLRSLIRTGRLAPGERLPSFREMSEWANVHVNTVRAVYARLAQERLVETRHGQGSFVAEGVEPIPELEAIAEEALVAAEAAGIDPREVAVVLAASAGMAGLHDLGPTADAEQEALPDLAGESEAIEVREELRRQIGRLEAALASYVRDLPQAAVPERAEAPRIVGVEQLEQTRDALIARLSEAQQAAEQRARREARARTRREAMMRNPERHKWEAVSSQEAGEPGESDYRVEPRFGPLGMAMNWWRVKASGDEPRS
jgi:DNA-binding transcriptional regulator YhcF (GntR family)